MKRSITAVYYRAVYTEDMIMNEIKCPACGKVFQVDERGYAQILHQVRDKEFEK